MSQTKYFEFVGKTGCRRCETEACDAIIPANQNSSIGVTSTAYRFEEMVEIFEEPIKSSKKSKKRQKSKKGKKAKKSKKLCLELKQQG